jgi:hypothetical protein
VSARFDCVVLDFDGTFTDVEREAIPFLEVYREGLERLVGAPIDERWARAVEVVEGDPDAHGFEYGGRIVAPSHADPYILAPSVANLVLAEHRELSGEARAEALEGLFAESYAKADTVFRPDAREVVEAVLGNGAPVFIVTNSRTAHVADKVRALVPERAERIEIRGDARKFHLVDPEPSDPRFAALPESMWVEGLGRPMYLRRGRYFEALRRIWKETGATPEGTIVAGDIFELDLALPAALGARVHLVARARTPSYERAAAERAGGTWSTELRGLLDLL